MKKNDVKRALSHVGRYSLPLAVSLILAAAYVVLTLMLPKIAGHAIDFIATSPEGLKNALIMFIVCAVSAAVIQWIMSLINNKVTYHILRDIRKEAFDHIQVLDLSYLDKNPAGGLVSRITADADQFADGLLMGFTQLFTGIATIIGSLIFMIQSNWKAALIVVALTPISLLWQDSYHRIPTPCLSSSQRQEENRQRISMK